VSHFSGSEMGCGTRWSTNEPRKPSRRRCERHLRQYSDQPFSGRRTRLKKGVASDYGCSIDSSVFFVTPRTLSIFSQYRVPSSRARKPLSLQRAHTGHHSSAEVVDQALLILRMCDAPRQKCSRQHDDSRHCYRRTLDILACNDLSVDGYFTSSPSWGMSSMALISGFST
jgi:hypothetical protein